MELNREIQMSLARLKDDPFWQYLAGEYAAKENALLAKMCHAKSWEETLRTQGEWQALQFFRNTVEAVRNQRFPE